MKYLIATETREAAPKEAHGHHEGVQRAKEGSHGSELFFHQRQQQPVESVAIYVAELRKLAVPCRFGESLNEASSDQLICGLCDEAYQKCLLSERELTLDSRLPRE